MPDPTGIVGLLADGDRLRVTSALVLGAESVEDVVAATGLDVRRAATALSRLVAGGLVEEDTHGYRVLEEELRSAARRSAGARASEPEALDAPPEVARVLRAFVRDGRLVSIPTVRSKRLVVLDLLAQRFEPGRRYSEATVNATLKEWHPDTAALRRYLVDEGFMARSAGRYWRTGGSVPERRDD